MTTVSTTCRWTGSSAVVPWWGRHPLGILLAMLPSPSQEQRALDELIARAVNRMKGRQRRPFSSIVSGDRPCRGSPSASPARKMANPCPRMDYYALPSQQEPSSYVINRTGRWFVLGAITSSCWMNRAHSNPGPLRAVCHHLHATHSSAIRPARTASACHLLDLGADSGRDRDPASCAAPAHSGNGTGPGFADTLASSPRRTRLAAISHLAPYPSFLR